MVSTIGRAFSILYGSNILECMGYFWKAIYKQLSTTCASGAGNRVTGGQKMEDILLYTISNNKRIVVGS